MNRKKNKYNKLFNLIEAKPVEAFTVIACILGMSCCIVFAIIATIYF